MVNECGYLVFPVLFSSIRVFGYEASHFKPEGKVFEDVF